MKILFWLLDVNEELSDEGSEIRLWGLDNKGRHILVVDRSFLPYVYIVLGDTADSKTVINKIKAQTLQPFRVDEAIDKKFFGKPVRAMKITCRNSISISKHTSSLSKTDGVKCVLEDDIRYSSRYLIDNEVNPCGWHEIEVEEVENRFDVKADGVYLAKSRPKAVERKDSPNLRVLSFSIICYSSKGSPKASIDPVSVISIATNEGSRKQLVARDSDDRPLIQSFIDFIQAFDPDMIVGYGSNTFEWSYLLERAKKLGLELFVDRSHGEPHTSVFGHTSITGRINIDFYELSDEIQEVKVKTLENIAKYFGIIKRRGEAFIEETEIQQFWEDNGKRPALLKGSAEKALVILRISQMLLDFAMQLSTLVGLPLDQVGTAAVGFRTESYLIRQAHNLGELVPSRVERPYFPYKGGIVLEPQPGVHEKTAVLDFKSMYPNIMISNNISPDTYIEPEEKNPPDGVYVAPEVKYRFRKSPPGFFNKVLSNLIETRDEMRDALKKIDQKSRDYRILDARQRAIKVITNAIYGYTGWIGARWYVRQVAEATAAWGRYTITHAIDLANKQGLKVIYGDTDSLFVKYDSEKIEDFLKSVQEELKLEIRPDEIYERIFFTEAKKRYAGLFPDGRLDIVGLEVARGDWSEAAKTVQERVLEIILKENSPEKAAAFVRQYIVDLKEKRIPYNDLVIWKTLTKEPGEYAVKAPHVEAAKRYIKEGWQLTLGDKIGFVIVKGLGKLHERALPYSLASFDKLDLQYYEEQQIIPAALRILSIYKVSEEDLKPKHSMTDYLK